MDIFLESDVELDNDAIVAQIQKIIPDAAVIKITIRSQLQHALLQQFDAALDKADIVSADRALKQFKETLYAPDGTATIKLMRIELAEAGGDDNNE